MYKIGATKVYSTIDTGGSLVDCPMCAGEGEIKKLDEKLKDLSDDGSKEKATKKASGKKTLTKKASSKKASGKKD